MREKGEEGRGGEGGRKRGRRRWWEEERKRGGRTSDFIASSGLAQHSGRSSILIFSSSVRTLSMDWEASTKPSIRLFFPTETAPLISPQSVADQIVQYHQYDAQLNQKAITSKGKARAFESSTWDPIPTPDGGSFQPVPKTYTDTHMIDCLPPSSQCLTPPKRIRLSLCHPLRRAFRLRALYKFGYRPGALLPKWWKPFLPSWKTIPHGGSTNILILG